MDGRAGDYIRNKLVLDPDQAALLPEPRRCTNPNAPFQPLDPNDVGAQYVPRTGASWEGHKGDVNGIFDAPVAGKTPGTPLNTLTFGFFETKADVDAAHFQIAGNAAGVSRADGFSTFDAAQRDAARQAMATWDEIIDVAFKETSSAQADINFMNTTTGPIQASAFLPYDYGTDFARVAGDVAVNPNQATNHQFDEGQYGLTTLVHELGHSLGLEHPGNYNFGPGFAVDYVNGAEYYQDLNQYSIMSYWGGSGNRRCKRELEQLDVLSTLPPRVFTISWRRSASTAPTRPPVPATTPTVSTPASARPVATTTVTTSSRRRCRSSLSGTPAASIRSTCRVTTPTRRSTSTLVSSAAPAAAALFRSRC